MIKLSGYEDNLDPKPRKELVRYFGDVRNSKGFDIENDAPLVKRWMHPVDHLQGPEAAIIERCARVAVHHYNVLKKGKKILKFDEVVKATLGIKCIRVYYITLEAKEESKNETTTYQARVNYHSHRDTVGEGFDVQIFRPKKATTKSQCCQVIIDEHSSSESIAESGEEVDADEFKLNTILALRADEDIPIDGVVVDGNCEVDGKTLTAESFPVPKQVDSTLWAGIINLNGYVSVRTTALAEDCVVAKMAKLVEEAQNSKSNT